MGTEILLLLVEDEQLIRMNTQFALEGGGYSVVAASDGAQAMSEIDNRHASLSGLVTDIRLGPGPNGWDLAKHARELNPLIAVVYMTGDSGVDWPAYGVPKSIVLQKPFADAQLLTAISTLLNDTVVNTGTPPTAPSG